jgi:hypothetical protein
MPYRVYSVFCCFLSFCMITTPFRGINVCLARTSSIEIKILHKVFEKICESKLCKFNMWGPEEGLKVIDDCLGEFWTNIVRISTCLVRGVAELE